MNQQIGGTTYQIKGELLYKGNVVREFVFIITCDNDLMSTDKAIHLAKELYKNKPHDDIFIELEEI